MSKALRYEHFVLDAFKLATNKTVDRGQDPAHLAEADLFNISSYFHRVKCFLQEKSAEYCSI